MVSVVLALRFALRIAVRSRWQSLLVIALIAIPVTGLVSLLTLNASLTPSIDPGFSSGNPYEAIVAVLSVFGLMEFTVLCSAPFTVTASRHRLLLAMIASQGGRRGLLFAIVCVYGMVLALVGGVVGSLVGVAIAAVTIGTQSARFPEYSGVHIDIRGVLLCLTIAAVAGFFASAAPALGASRIDVASAMRGRAQPVRQSARLPVVGAIITLAGIGVLFLGGAISVASAIGESQFTGGAVLLVIGSAASVIGVAVGGQTLLLWSAVPLRHLGSAAHLGSRDSSRNLSRSLPLLATVISTAFIGSLAVAGMGALQAQSVSTYEYSGPLNSVQVGLYTQDDQGNDTLEPVGAAVRDAMDQAFGNTRARVISAAYDSSVASTARTGPLPKPRKYISRACRHEINCNSAYFSNEGGGVGALTIVGSSIDLKTVLGRSPSRRAVAALRDGTVVSLYPGFVANGKVTFDWIDQATGNKTGLTRSVAAIVEQPRHAGDFGLIMSPLTAQGLGITAVPTTVIADLSAPPTSSQLHQLDSALAHIGGGDLSPLVEAGPDTSTTQGAWWVICLAIAVCLAAATLTIALARATSRRDDDAVISLGATPALRRGYAFWQVVIPVGIGSIVGTALGVLPALALSVRMPGPFEPLLPFAPLWGQLAVLAFATPLFIGVGAWGTAGGRRWAPQRAPIG